MKTLNIKHMFVFLTLFLSSTAFADAFDDALKTGQIKLLTTGGVVVQLDFVGNCDVMTERDKSVIQAFSRRIPEFDLSKYEINVVSYTLGGNQALLMDRNTKVVKHLYDNGFGKAAEFNSNTMKITYTSAIAGKRILRNRVEVEITPVKTII